MAPTQRTNGHRFYRPELDALRFFAFLGVFIHHKSHLERLPGHLFSNPLAHRLLVSLHVTGAYGVDLFFLLSSYLITTLLRREVAVSGRLNVRDFYVRRALRIWPLYFVFLALCGVLWSLNARRSFAPGFFVASALFAGNWYLIYNSQVWFPLLLLWTISIEEQFYLVWPLLLRFAKRGRIIAVSVVSIVLAHVTLAWLRHAGIRSDAAISYNTLVQMQFFGLGALLALWSEDHADMLAPSLRLLLATAGLGSLATATFFDNRGGLVSAGLLTYNVCFALIALGVVLIFRAALGLPQSILPRWLLYLGRISYGLYVLNFFADWLGKKITTFGRSAITEVVVAFAVNILLAMLSYHLLELPFLRLKRRFETIRTRETSLSPEQQPFSPPASSSPAARLSSISSPARSTAPRPKHPSSSPRRPPSSLAPAPSPTAAARIGASASRRP